MKLRLKALQVSLVLGCFSACLFGQPVQAAGSDIFDFSASLRNTALYADHFEFSPFVGQGNDQDFSSVSQGRLVILATAQWGVPLSFDVQGLTTYLANSQTRSTQATGLSSTARTYQAFDLEWNPVDEDHQTMLIGLDRAHFKIQLPAFDVSVGRQPINFSKTYFWNVLDLFGPFNANQFDRDYKASVDALRVDIPFGNTSGMNLIVAGGGRQPSFVNIEWEDSAFLARFFGNWRGFDVSSQGGKVRGGYHAGIGWVGEIAGVETRAEGAMFHADQPISSPLYKNYFSSVLGIGRRFQNTLDVQAEYFFNGNGSEKTHFNDALFKVASGELLNWGKHLTGVTVSYEILPILVGQLGYLFSFTDFSSELLPQIKWSVTDNIDCLAGAINHFGKRPTIPSVGDSGLRSEFGSQSDYYYVQLKAYF